MGLSHLGIVGYRSCWLLYIAVAEFQGPPCLCHCISSIPCIVRLRFLRPIRSRRFKVNSRDATLHDVRRLKRWQSYQPQARLLWSLRVRTSRLDDLRLSGIHQSFCMTVHDRVLHTGWNSGVKEPEEEARLLPSSYSIEVHSCRFLSGHPYTDV